MEVEDMDGGGPKYSRRRKRGCENLDGGSMR
jgi:hypothetical protein